MLCKVRVRSRKTKVRAVSESIIRVVATVIRKGFRHLRQLSLQSAECGVRGKATLSGYIDIYDMARPPFNPKRIRFEWLYSTPTIDLSGVVREVSLSLFYLFSTYS